MNAVAVVPESPPVLERAIAETPRRKFILRWFLRRSARSIRHVAAHSREADAQWEADMRTAIEPLSDLAHRNGTKVGSSV